MMVGLGIEDPIAPQVNTGDEGDSPPFDFGGDELGGWDDEPAAPPAPLDEDRVRAFLVGAGQFGNLAHDRDVPEQWLFTERELDALVPPLTSIANRHNVVRLIIEKSDYVAVPVLLAAYGKRNLQDGRDARENRKENHGYERAEADGAGAGDEVEGGWSPGRDDGAAWGAGVPAEQVAHVGVDSGGS